MENCSHRYSTIYFCYGSCSCTECNTDIDEKNMIFAKRNILQNNLKSRIHPLNTKPNDPLVPLDAFGLER